MFFSGIKYILFKEEKGKKMYDSPVVKQSYSSCCYTKQISQKEIVNRLEIADNIFYEEGEIQEVVIKTKINGRVHTRYY